MAKRVQIRREAEAAVNAQTPAEGELAYVTDAKELRVGDGATQGGGLTLQGAAREAQVITVGASGDYATINAALQAASAKSQRYAKEGLGVTVRLLSGFVMAEQVFVYGHDLSYVTITAEDAEVTITRSAMTDVPDKVNWRTGVFPAFTAMNGAGLPTIGCVFAFDTSGTGVGTVGVLIKENSKGLILRECGIKNAGWRGLYVDNGQVYARETVWTGSGLAGGPAAGAAVRISNGATANVREANGSASAQGLYVSSAHVTAIDFDASGAVSATVPQGSAPGHGLQAASEALVHAANIDVSDADGNGFVVTDHARVEAPNADASGAGNFGAAATEGGELYAYAITVANAASRGLNANINGVIIARDATITGVTGRAVNASAGSFIDIGGATVTGASDAQPIQLYNGSRIQMDNAVFNGQLKLSSGCYAMAAGARTSGGDLIDSDTAPNSPGVNGLLVGEGGLVSADNGDATTFLSVADLPVQLFETPLTTNRGVRLPVATSGRTFRIVRTAAATGSGKINVQQPNSTVFVQLDPAEWADVAPNSDGTAWVLTARGSLA